MSRLAALDLSTNVGHARFVGRARPRFGTLLLEGPDLSFKLGQFDVWLDRWFADEPFDALVWERPLLTPTDTVDLLELLYGLAGACYAFIGRQRIAGIHLAWREVSVTDAKIALTGNGKATKDDMLYAARRILNWQVNTHHEADAGAVGVVGYERIYPKAISS